MNKSEKSIDMEKKKVIIVAVSFLILAVLVVIFTLLDLLYWSKQLNVLNISSMVLVAAVVVIFICKYQSENEIAEIKTSKEMDETYNLNGKRTAVIVCVVFLIFTLAVIITLFYLLYWNKPFNVLNISFIALLTSGAVNMCLRLKQLKSKTVEVEIPKETAKIEIPICKKTLLLSIVDYIILVVIGFSLLATLAGQQLIFFPALIKGVGGALILYFGAKGIYRTSKELSHKTIALTIDEHGIFDNSYRSELGFISWSDIKEIKTEYISAGKSLLIFPENPEKYLNEAEGSKRKLMKKNIRMSGTPLVISSETLKRSFKSLEKFIDDKFSEYKERSA